MVCEKQNVRMCVFSYRRILFTDERDQIRMNKKAKMPKKWQRMEKISLNNATTNRLKCLKHLHRWIVAATVYHLFHFFKLRWSLLTLSLALRYSSIATKWRYRKHLPSVRSFVLYVVGMLVLSPLLATWFEIILYVGRWCMIPRTNDLKRDANN